MKISTDVIFVDGRPMARETFFDLDTAIASARGVVEHNPDATGIQLTVDGIRTPEPEEMLTGMALHAKQELELLGEDPHLTNSIVDMIRTFASFGHSGSSAEIAIDYVNKLLRQENLTPLTSDPDEWEDRSEISGAPLWQNKRNSKWMSEDGGQTCWSVNDPDRETWSPGEVS